LRIFFLILGLLFVVGCAPKVTYHEQQHLVCIDDGTCYEGY